MIRFDPPHPVSVVVLIKERWTDPDTGDFMARDVDGVVYRNPGETGSDWTRDRQG